MGRGGGGCRLRTLESWQECLCTLGHDDGMRVAKTMCTHDGYASYMVITRVRHLNIPRSIWSTIFGE